MKTVGEEHEKPKQSELGRSGRSLRPSGLVEGRPRTDERNTRHGSLGSQGRSSFSAGVRAVVRRRRDPRAGSALGEGKGSTGPTATHLRTTHDRERLCASSGCGRQNDVRHEGHPTPPSPEQCKPAIRLMMGASHRRIAAELVAGCVTGSPSDGAGQSPWCAQRIVGARCSRAGPGILRLSHQRHFVRDRRRRERAAGGRIYCANKTVTQKESWLQRDHVPQFIVTNARVSSRLPVLNGLSPTG